MAPSQLLMRKAGARALTTRDHRCGRLCRRTRPASTRGNRTKRPRENVRAAVCPSCPLLYQGAPINASRLLVVLGRSTHYPLSVCSNRAVHRCRAGVRTSDCAVAASWLSSIQSRARRWSHASRIVRSSPSHPSHPSRLAPHSCRVRRAPAHRPVRRLVTHITAWCASAIRDATRRGPTRSPGADDDSGFATTGERGR